MTPDSTAIMIPILSILGALCIGAMSPGPSFVMVVRVSVAASRRNGLAAALGMGFGGLLFAVLALAGLQALLMQVTWLYLILKALGGAYLVYLAYLIWRSLALGFGTQISNPKTAIYYASMFAAFLPQHPSAGFFWILPPMIFLIEAGWYTLVALAFSSELPRAAYLRAKVWVDRLAATVLGLLGGKLILEALRAKV
jgi:threonine/homoserine/homoserine lactone efflux protein